MVRYTMPPNSVIVLVLFGSAFVLILFVNSKLFSMTLRLSEDIQNSLQKSDQLAVLNRKLRELEEQILRIKHSANGHQSATKSEGSFPKVKYRNEESRKRILVTGGAGFVGSHLVDRLMMDGHEVIALDNFFTGRRRNVETWIGHPNFELVHHDVTLPYLSEVDYIYHLASPASPPHYMYNPVKTLKTNLIGSINMLGLARRAKARILLASTSEVYGDPEFSPQPETYWGRVNTIGPRSCYDEGKRASESLFVAYNKQENVSIRIARIFNTFGPRMHLNDGRVVSNFIIQALTGKDITIYGHGNQSRSFQYVEDLVEGLIALMESDVTTPVNIGNPEEYTINDFAALIKEFVGSSSKIKHLPAMQDDPQQRKPNITKAKQLLNWTPKMKMLDGIKITVDYFQRELEEEKERENEAARKSEEARP